MIFLVKCEGAFGYFYVWCKAAYDVGVPAAVLIKYHGAVDLFFGFIYRQADFKEWLFFVFGRKVYYLVKFAVYLFIAIVNVFVAFFINGEYLRRVKAFAAVVNIAYFNLFIFFDIGPLGFTIADDLLVTVVALSGL